MIVTPTGLANGGSSLVRVIEHHTRSQNLITQSRPCRVSVFANYCPRRHLALVQL